MDLICSECNRLTVTMEKLYRQQQRLKKQYSNDIKIGIQESYAKANFDCNMAEINRRRKAIIDLHRYLESRGVNKLTRDMFCNQFVKDEIAKEIKVLEQITEHKRSENAKTITQYTEEQVANWLIRDNIISIWESEVRTQIETRERLTDIQKKYDNYHTYRKFVMKKTKNAL